MQVDSSQTIVFFWSYVAIIYFVVFNIALAVILEVYSDIRKQNQDYFRIKKQESQSRLQGNVERDEASGEGRLEEQENEEDDDGHNVKIKRN